MATDTEVFVTDVAARNRRNRTAGKSWERAIEVGGREHGVDTERTRDSGIKDQGDAAMRIRGHYLVIEAKNATLNVTGFLREAEVEAKHFAEKRHISPDLVHPVVFWKRRGFGKFEDGVAMMTIGEYLRLTKSL